MLLSICKLRISQILWKPSTISLGFSVKLWWRSLTIDNNLLSRYMHVSTIILIVYLCFYTPTFHLRLLTFLFVISMSPNYWVINSSSRFRKVYLWQYWVRIKFLSMFFMKLLCSVQYRRPLILFVFRTAVFFIPLPTKRKDMVFGLVSQSFECMFKRLNWPPSTLVVKPTSQ